MNSVFSRVTARCFHIYNSVLQRNSNLIFRSILGTPPIETDAQSDTVLFTLLDQKNYCAYLLAAKSFLRFCPRVRVVIQSDGSLSTNAVRDIQKHLPGAEVWEKESSIEVIRQNMGEELAKELPALDRCQFFLLLKLLIVVFGLPQRKVILFDSDLVFFRPPTFVDEWIEGNRVGCFHSDGGSHLASRFRAMDFDFSKVDIGEFNAGFIGLFNSVTSSRLAEIIRRIRSYDPSAIDHWEIEQAIWSVLFNDFSDPVNLDNVEKDYVASGYWPYNRIKKSVMVHFIGSVRFKNCRYIRAARRVVRELKNPEQHHSINPSA